MTVFIILIFVIAATNANVLDDCSRLFNPQNYMDQLPSLSLPYVNSVPIPSQIIPLIKPSPVVTTKVINFVTKYVVKNPVCIKVSGNKPPCQQKSAYDFLVTKEYFVGDLEGKSSDNHGLLIGETKDNTEEDLFVEGSESFRRHSKPQSTPLLDPTVKHILIEDRLDHLAEILPYYTRRKTYETSTITVTKVREGHKPMATLLVKNCVPTGIPRCPPKKRKSKVSNFGVYGDDVNEGFYRD